MVGIYCHLLRHIETSWSRKMLEIRVAYSLVRKKQWDLCVTSCVQNSSILTESLSRLQEMWKSKRQWSPDFRSNVFWKYEHNVSSKMSDNMQRSAQKAGGSRNQELPCFRLAPDLRISYAPRGTTPSDKPVNTFRWMSQNSQSFRVHINGFIKLVSCRYSAEQTKVIYLATVCVAH